jgi:hypothetical protein
VDIPIESYSLSLAWVSSADAPRLQVSVHDRLDLKGEVIKIAKILKDAGYEVDASRLL